MKGVIFNAVEDAVERAFGADGWDDTLGRAKVDGSYTSLGNYDDEELAAIERQRLDGAVVRFERLLMRERGLTRSTSAIRREAQRIVSSLLGVAIDHSFDPAAHAEPRRRRQMVERVIGPRS